jgi:signal transduction histidine kinase
VEETRSAGLVTTFEVQGECRTLEPNAELTLYRAAQEGLTNVRKHARASRVDVHLNYSDPKMVYLTVQDNGVGSKDGSDDGFGLLGIKERVQLLGGAMEIESTDEQGFKLLVTVPG